MAWGFEDSRRRPGEHVEQGRHELLNKALGQKRYRAHFGKKREGVTVNLSSKSFQSKPPSLDSSKKQTAWHHSKRKLLPPQYFPPTTTLLVKRTSISTDWTGRIVSLKGNILLKCVHTP